MEECKYKLWGMTVAPTIPKAKNNMDLSVAIFVSGIKPRNTSPTFDLLMPLHKQKQKDDCN